MIEPGKGYAGVIDEQCRRLYRQRMKYATIVSNYLYGKVHARVWICAEVVADHTMLSCNPGCVQSCCFEVHAPNKLEDAGFFGYL